MWSLALGIISNLDEVRCRFQQATRAALVGLVLLIVVILGWLHEAKAKVGEALIDFGQELSMWAGVHVSNQTRILSLNGVQLHLLTASSSYTVSEVVDRFYGMCRDNNGPAIPDVVRKRLNARTQDRGLGLLDGVYRHATEDAGVVACLDTGGRLFLDGMTARLQQFAKTGDLSAIGRLRYVVARRSNNGTSVLAMWTEGRTQILDMFPREGDAPGLDPVDIPRPVGIRRILSAREVGLPYEVTVYNSDSLSAAELQVWYVSALVARGWNLADVSGKDCLVAKSGTRLLEICLTKQSEKRTAITLAELS
jgi:hypothetical protein